MKKKNEIYSLIGLLFIIVGVTTLLVITYLCSYHGFDDTVFMWLLGFFNFCLIFVGIGIIAFLITDNKFTIDFFIKKGASDEKEIPTK